MARSGFSSTKRPDIRPQLLAQLRAERTPRPQPIEIRTRERLCTLRKSEDCGESVARGGESEGARQARGTPTAQRQR